MLYYKVKSVDGWEIEVKLLLFLSDKPPSIFFERNELLKTHFLAGHGTVRHDFIFGSGRLSNHQACKGRDGFSAEADATRFDADDGGTAGYTS